MLKCSEIIVIKLVTTEEGTKLQKEQSFQCKIVMRVAEGGRMEGITRPSKKN